jgi:hypothetical protein
MKVYTGISRRLLSTWTNEAIYDEVVKSGIKDEDDVLATYRALVLIRDERRKNRSQD